MKRGFSSVRAGLPSVSAVAGCIAAFIVALYSFGCSTAPLALRAPDERFVHAHTSGVVSVNEAIRVEFVQDMKGAVDDTAFLVSALRFDPPIEGKTVWSGSNIIEFRPDRPLPRETRYTAHFSASALRSVYSGAQDFDFTFKTLTQGMELVFDRMIPEGDGSSLALSLTITTGDMADPSELVKTVQFYADGSVPEPVWKHEKTVHRLTLGGIRRGEQAGQVSVSWNGAAIGAVQKGEQVFSIPAKADFAILGVVPVSADDSYVDITFSDPLDASQDISGLIRFEDEQGRIRKVQPVRDGSRVKLYSASGWSGSGKVLVDAGIRSAGQKRLVSSHTATVTFPSQKPAVRFAGAGVIIPTSQGLTIPIETMNLKYVMVEATRVFHDNVPQFLQVNNLSGTNEMYRVGKVVWRQVVDLGWKAENQDKWTRYGLELSKLMQANPDGLFRLRLTFRQPHVVWPMPDATAATPDASIAGGNLDWQGQGIPEGDEESSYWDYWEYEEEVDYRQRTNPANIAYYRKWWDHDIDANRNMMISDIGLMAKRGTDGVLSIAASNLKSAQPLPRASIRLLDYTRQTVATGVTDDQGFIRFEKLNDRPYFVVASSGGQFGYLKLGDGDALSISHFDVAGDRAEGGVKGFIYGERGVWRPGDTMFLNFILWDPNRTIPADHPVSLELYNPLGQLTETVTQNKGADGFYHFPVATGTETPTGTYLARIRLGGRTFEKSLKVETVMPNRLKIDFSLLNSPNGVTDGRISGRILAAWLHGAKAPGLRTVVDASLSPGVTSFEKYPGYTFDDPARPFQSEKQTIFDGPLDTEGRVDFSGNLGLEDFAPGKLRINFDTRVYEPGGAFSSDVFSADYHPYNRYVGIQLPPGDVARGMLLTDVDHVTKIVLVDPTGRPVSSGTVRVDFYKIDWRWWWESGDDPEALADFIASESSRMIKSENVQIRNGAAEWKLNLRYPEWGRYLVRVTDVQGGHSTGIIKYIDWPGWAGRQQKDGPGGAAVLSLSTDKTGYAVGEQVVVNIPGNTQGRGLVSIERAGRIIRQEWIQPSGANTQYRFTAGTDMSPNIYVHVTFLQPHLQTANDVPIRTYGIIPVKVDNPRSHLKPVIVSDEIFKPGTTVKVKVSEASGQPMTYTLAMVDEGLLSLTRYVSQDPWDTFYRREASLTKSWDLYDFVAGAFAGRLENMLAIGGGDEGDAAGKRKPNRFPPMVRFVPPATLNAGATNEHSFEMPEYVGAVRLMVVAARQSAGNAGFPAYGTSEKSVLVKKEVMVLGTLPRVMAPGEEALVPVSVFYLGEGVRDVPVTIRVGGQLGLVGTSSQTVRFREAGEQTVYFRMKGLEAVGTGTVSLTARGNVDTATQNVEMEVRLPTNSVTVTEIPEGTGFSNGILPAARNWTSSGISLPGVAGTNKVSVEVSTIPPIDLGKRLDFLIQYPHGCIEQTTSAVFPQLYLASLMDVSQDRALEIQSNIVAGIDRLKYFQTETGGFSYWPGEDSWISGWGTNYAGHFLVEAKRAGYAVPASMLSAWRAYQQQQANSWNDFSNPSKIEQAYRLFVLALDGTAELSAMNRLREMSLPDQARWRLAAAYALVGQTSAAFTLVEGATTNIRTYKELGQTFGTALRDKAMILETMAIMDMGGQALVIARDISTQLSMDQWLSTQETAYSLMAMAKVSGILSGNGQIKVSYTINGMRGNLQSSRPLASAEVPLGTQAGALRFEIKNEGTNPVFPRLIMSGTPALGTEKASNQTLRMTVRYRDSDGVEIRSLDKLVAGSDLFAELTVQNLSPTQILEQLALTHQVASGLEIVNTRMSAAAQDQGGEGREPVLFDYQDIRDDRVFTYFSLKPLSQKTFRVQLTPTYQGRFYLPSIKAEAMYDASIQATVPGQWIAIGERPPATRAITGGAR